MSANIVQKLKVIAANKMQSDSSSAKIILEAAEIIESKSFKSSFNKEELKNEDYAGDGRIFQVGLYIDISYQCIIPTLGLNKIKKISKICNVELHRFEKISFYKVHYVATSKYRSKLHQFIDDLQSNKFTLDTYSV